MPRGDIWLGDALLAVAELSPDGAPDAALGDAIARLLGLDATAAGSGHATAVARQAGTHTAADAAAQDAAANPPTADPPATTEPQAAGPDQRLPSRLQPLQVAPGSAPAGWATQPALQPLPALPLPRPSLLPRQRRRALLTAWLSQTADDGEPDLPRIVAQLAQGRPLLRLPRRPRRTLRHGAELRIDRAPWLAPFHADQAELAAYLAQLLPRDTLRVVAIDGSPVPLPPPTRRRAGRQQPAAGLRAPLLLLSDLGAGYRAQAQMPAPAAAWRALADANRRVGRRTLALSPWPQPPGTRVPAIESLLWDERLRLADVARARAGQPPLQRQRRGEGDANISNADQDAQALARWVSPALCVTPWLLRQARVERLPQLGPQAEAALWFSDTVQSAGEDGLVLDRDAARALAATLSADERDAALALLARARPAAGDVTAIEEALLALELRGRLDDDTANAVLMPALKALAAAPEPGAAGAPAREVAHWAAHAWTRFSPALRSTRPARQLAFAAARHLSTRSWLAADGAPAPALPAGSDWLFNSTAGATRELSVELRAYADGSTNLVIGPPQPATSALHRIDVPADGPVWIEVSVHRGDGSAPTVQTVALAAGEPTQVDVAWQTANAALELQVLAGPRWRISRPATAAETLRDAVWHIGPHQMAALIVSDRRAVVPVLGRHDDPSFVDRLGRPSVLLQPDEPGQDQADGGIGVAVHIVGKLSVHDANGRLDAWVLERDADAAAPRTWRALDPQVQMPLDAAPGRAMFVPLARAHTLQSTFVALGEDGTYDVEPLQARRPSQADDRAGQRLAAADQADIDKTIATDPALLLDEAGWRVIAVIDAVRQPGTKLRYRLGGVRWPVLQQQALGLDHAADSNRPDVAKAAAPTALEAEPPRSFGTSLRARFAQAIERRDEADVGLFRIALPPGRGMQLVRASWPGGSEPVLLFIHGEMADTEANFADLLREPGADRDRLRQRYGERVFAWRWRSVTRGLVDNALQLAQAMAGRQVHICSFSAGGLLAELLCFVNQRQGADMHGAAWKRWSTAPGYRPGDAKGVDALAQTVNSLPPLHIGRFVRVACPAAGTALYGSGVDKSLGLLKMLPYIGTGLSLLPGMSTLFGDPQASPGLAMLAPGAGVLPLLTVAARTDAPLSIVAGVAQGAGVLRNIGLGLAGWVQQARDHDMVVPLASAFGGLERSGGVDYLEVRGPEVNHFNFFNDIRTRHGIVSALVDSGTPNGFAHAQSLAELQQRYARKAPAALAGAETLPPA